MNKVQFVFCALVVFSLFSTASPEAFGQNFPGNANWISTALSTPENDSLFYGDNPAPLFRKEFNADKNLVTATLMISAAGYYKAGINGERIGKNRLDPAWTDFSKRIYYTEYDITKQVKSGDNCLGVVLGNGFYNPLPLRMWGRRNLREVLPVGNPAFIAKILLTYSNGQTEEILTDKSWKFNTGPIVKNNVYLGEVYNSGYEIPGWDLPGFDDSLWNQAELVNGPGGTLQEAFFPPVQVTRKIKPVKITAPAKGIFLVDMGENFTGLYNIKLNGKKADTITFRFGERIYDDGTLNPMTTVCGQIKREGMGGPGAPAIAWQTDSYIFNDKQEVWYQPEFTFHTFRYIEISGLDYQPEIDDIEGLALHSAVSRDNGFSCSSGLLNSIQEATQRTFLSNLMSVQSDCAAREKFGYGGDLNATSEAFINNFGMREFYRKTIYDWVDAINDSVFVDTAPYVGIQYCGISWESAFLTTQYYLYLYYDDIEIVKELYNLDKAWMEKASRLHPDGLVSSGLSDHESLEPVPVELTGTCHYLQCARIMAKFAAIMKDKEGEKEYNLLANRLKEKIRATFWDQPVLQKINRQTLFSSLLYFDVVPEKDLKAAQDSLLSALKNGPSQHFNTGIFGTKYILEALSENGFPDAVFDVVNSTVYPGWGFMIGQGATTIWETWKESDNTYSNCHPMFGSVSEWFYRWLAGIQPNPGFPGFKRFWLKPFVPGDLEFVNCNYLSPYGNIVSNWKKEGGNKIIFEFSVPENCIAEFRIPPGELQSVTVVRNGRKKSVQPGKTFNDTPKIELKSGDYEISVTYSEL